MDGEERIAHAKYRTAIKELVTEANFECNEEGIVRPSHMLSLFSRPSRG
jgi:hypothetical protein